ncbi:MAG: Crp/Fnr family transcriptional regulator [Chloroflexota bacterium]
MTGGIMAAQVDVLRRVPLFSSMDQAHLKAVSQKAFQKTLDRRELVLLEGEIADALYIVASGVVKVFMSSPDGKEQILYLARPGDVINEVSILDGLPSPLSAETLGQVVLHGLRRKELVELLKEYPALATGLTGLLTARLRGLFTLVADLSFRDVTARLARLLLVHARKGSGAELPRDMLTQQDMAAMIGTAREMVGRSLKNLQSLKAIRMERHRIAVVNEKLLEKIAALG